jgi:hypothetical protein
MTVMPTLEGGLRIDAEDAGDWDLLRGIVEDANGGEPDLASRLGGMVDDTEIAEDWQEFVVPDLREEFQDELAEIAAWIESAAFDANGGAGPIWITRENAYPWYSALNQARLTLEEVYHFGPEGMANPRKMKAEKQAAFIRSGFYSDIQSLLLEHVMR